MHTQLIPQYQDTPEGQQAEAILGKCVHCGFCNATCPTYQLLGDELDGPRGRIYLIKQVLEGTAPTRKTQLHLDRCLTCRNCESTCPSGVEYGHLIDIGRKIVDQQVTRPVAQQALRAILSNGLVSPLFGPAMKLGRALRWALPPALSQKLPAARSAGPWPRARHRRRVLLLAGCVQPAMQPNINTATARVLDAAGIETRIVCAAKCCGAIKQHLGDPEGGLAQMRANIDAWWPEIEQGAEAVVSNASGCSLMLKDYAHLLRHDAAYADKARRVSKLARDLSELLPDIATALGQQVAERAAQLGTLAYHPPCTLQHGQKLRGKVEQHLVELGFNLRLAAAESHLCCGSAGTYSVLQPVLALQLRERKLGHLMPLKPNAIISANIGCIAHLQAGTQTPVRHWVELLDQCLSPRASVSR